MSVARDYLQSAEREMSACNCSQEKIKETREENIRINAEKSGLRGMLEEKEKYIRFGARTLLTTEEDLKKTKSELEGKSKELTVISEQFCHLQIEGDRHKQKNRGLIEENNSLKNKL